MGAGFIDYIVADATVLPREDFGNFNEKAGWLPDSYQVCDVRRPISEPAPTRAQCGLPEGAFVFCCFNAAYKITPETFQSWMRLLAAAENSVLWLASPNPTAAVNLRAAAQVSGIAPDRLIFAPRVPSIADHLARHRQADLFLDTLPYNAHTTAADALRAGLPVLTCLGSTFAGRVGSSLLNAVGLPELITTSFADCEALALRLVREPALLAALRRKLAQNRNTTPLFLIPSVSRAISRPPMQRCGSALRTPSPRKASRSRCEAKDREAKAGAIETAVLTMAESPSTPEAGQGSD